LGELGLSLDDLGADDDSMLDEFYIWADIGGNLECLTLSWLIEDEENFLYEEYIEYIQEDCLNLRRIFIYGNQESNRELSGFLASYGDQLRSQGIT